MTIYLDTSTVLRALLGDGEPLREWGGWRRAYSSELMGVEARRTLDRLRLEQAPRRRGPGGRARRARGDGAGDRGDPPDRRRPAPCGPIDADRREDARRHSSRQRPALRRAPRRRPGVRHPRHPAGHRGPRARLQGAGNGIRDLTSKEACPSLGASRQTGVVFVDDVGAADDQVAVRRGRERSDGARLLPQAPDDARHVDASSPLALDESGAFAGRVDGYQIDLGPRVPVAADP